MAKNCNIHVRCTEEQLKDLVEQSKSLGYENYADFLRALLWDFDTICFKKNKLKSLKK
jgi:hypothetical protein